MPKTARDIVRKEAASMAAWHPDVPWSAAEQQPAPDVTMATSSWLQYVAMIVDYTYLKRIICTQVFAMSQMCAPYAAADFKKQKHKLIDRAVSHSRATHSVQEISELVAG